MAETQPPFRQDYRRSVKSRQRAWSSMPHTTSTGRSWITCARRNDTIHLPLALRVLACVWISHSGMPRSVCLSVRLPLSGNMQYFGGFQPLMDLRGGSECRLGACQSGWHLSADNYRASCSLLFEVRGVVCSTLILCHWCVCCCCFFGLFRGVFPPLFYGFYSTNICLTYPTNILSHFMDFSAAAWIWSPRR